MDFTAISDAVEFGTVVGALLALGGLQMACKVVVWGAHKVLDFIADRRGHV
ncbi:hypothetical protein [Variovorax paradoxus]|uniref:hypothetical protein n=1 Tax=Variovorax paradoxus TaxID=34073 RepID=UPI003ED030C5